MKTGKTLTAVSEQGCQVWGSDISEAMLVQARCNTAHPDTPIPLQQADYRDLPCHYQARFDAVVCLGSIGYMPDNNEFLRAFRSMHTVLRPNGILVLTVTLTDRQWEEKPRFKLVMNTPEASRVFVMDYFEQKVSYHVLDIFHSQAENRLETWEAELTILLRDQQEQLLKVAGFQQVDFYGGLDFSPYDKQCSKSLITVAVK